MQSPTAPLLGATVLLLAGVASPAAAQLTPLRWKLAPGDRLAWTATQKVESTLRSGSAKPVTTRIEMRLEWVWSVLPAGQSDDAQGNAQGNAQGKARTDAADDARRSADGAFRIRQSIQAIRVAMNAGNGKPLVYDSEAEPPAEPPAAYRDLRDSMRPWLRQPQSLTLSADGQLSDNSPRAEQPWRPPLAAMLPALPPRPVRPGAAWSDQRSESAAAGQLAIRRRFQWAPAAQPEVKLVMSGAISLVPQAADGDAGPLKLQRQSLRGEFHFDADAGHLSRASIRQSLATSRRGEEGRQLVTTVSRLQATARRVAGAGAGPAP